ncbi:LOW QUALITY PROTEIN: hypothetical protein PHPALM_29038 [Phytophthora palmivora]|uniref:Uncharacterized protein n=1 Tax=Phytophthora palmivora TaxID=4796 RepID=A0A2P4X8M0_9STRA|nr:LOW QUALITY PROTEIN: hypothetical protein PHPALM_29038 [Phytophthora palmivora]
MAHTRHTPGTCVPHSEVQPQHSCTYHEETDPARATAETSLRDVVERLQGQRGATFQGDDVDWRMWANHLTRNLNRSTWETAVQQPPPDYIANLLRLVNTQVEQHVAYSAGNVALDLMETTISDYQWELLEQYLDENESCLEVRNIVVMRFLRDTTPPVRTEVIDPLQQLENVEGMSDKNRIAC